MAGGDGHGDGFHGFVFLGGVAVVAAAHAALSAWRQRAPRSHQRVTLVGVWALPLLPALAAPWPLFLALWAAFTAAAAYFVWLAAGSGERLQRLAPRRMYQFFGGVYGGSLAVGAAGLAAVVALASGALAWALPPGGPAADAAVEAAVRAVALGLYFGVLARDLAEVCTDALARALERSRGAGGAPAGACAVCREDLPAAGAAARALDPEDAAAADPAGPETGARAAAAAALRALGFLREDAAELPCGHRFHELCLRGWLVVGKKDTCPACGEKVELRAVLRAPWQRPSLLWATLLDLVRYVVVWNPAMILLLHFWIVGWESLL